MGSVHYPKSFYHVMPIATEPKDVRISKEGKLCFSRYGFMVFSSGYTWLQEYLSLTLG
jgi:hypothetical protein